MGRPTATLLCMLRLQQRLRHHLLLWFLKAPILICRPLQAKCSSRLPRPKHLITALMQRGPRQQIALKSLALRHRATRALSLATPHRMRAFLAWRWLSSAFRTLMTDFAAAAVLLALAALLATEQLEDPLLRNLLKLLVDAANPRRSCATPTWRCCCCLLARHIALPVLSRLHALARRPPRHLQLA